MYVRFEKSMILGREDKERERRRRMARGGGSARGKADGSAKGNGRDLYRLRLVQFA